MWETHHLLVDEKQQQTDKSASSPRLIAPAEKRAKLASPAMSSVTISTSFAEWTRSLASSCSYFHVVRPAALPFYTSGNFRRIYYGSRQGAYKSDNGLAHQHGGDHTCGVQLQMNKINNNGNMEALFI